MEFNKYENLVLSGSFLEGICPILYVSQIMGIFPLKGIRPRPTKTIHFSWFSISTLICLAFMTWDSVYVVTHLYFHRNAKLTSSIITTFVFFAMGLLIYGAFLKLATRWVDIINWWTVKEQRFLGAPYDDKMSFKLKNKLSTIAIVIAFFAIVEHGLHQTTSIYAYVVKATNCNITNAGVYDLMQNRFSTLNHYIPGMFALILSQVNIRGIHDPVQKIGFVSLFATAAWNFLDLFIIVISKGINYRFEQHTNALKHHLKHETPTEKSMLMFRLDFIAICELLEYVDKHMGLIVFLSAANNIYFVCNQLLNAFNVLRHLTDYFYCWISLLYLIGRTFYLFLSAAAINETSQGPVSLLYNIPQQSLNQECTRLLFQINSSDISLSAMGFFNFTRGLILTMAGAIVTFELVMLQFGNTVYSLQPLCN